jgi:hypothetical protein
MTCVGAMPSGVLPPAATEPVDMLLFADATPDCAAAKPMRAETMTDLEKSILIVVGNWSFEKGSDGLLDCRERGENGCRRLAL